MKGIELDLYNKILLIFVHMASTASFVKCLPVLYVVGVIEIMRSIQLNPLRFLHAMLTTQ